MSLSRVLLLTDRHQLPAGKDLVGTVAACVEAGLEAVVLRELDLSPEERRALATALVATGATVVSARSWLAGTAGVHLAAAQAGQDARPAPFHGRSCHDEEEVRRAVEEGAAYLTISPVATSSSKPGYGSALGGPGVRRAARLAGPVPVFALGGVDAANAAAMRDAGAYGVAVMGAVMRAADPAASFARIAEAVR